MPQIHKVIPWPPVPAAYLVSKNTMHIFLPEKHSAINVWEKHPTEYPALIVSQCLFFYFMIINFVGRVLNQSFMC